MTLAGTAGTNCRNAILKCTRFTINDKDVARYINSSDLAQSLALSLTSVFSKLPKELPKDPSGKKAESWAIVHTDESSPFYAMLQLICFVNSLVSSTHPSIARNVCMHVYKDFLIPFFVPLIHQEDSYALVAVIAYLDACISRVQHPMLLKEFIQMILSTTYEDGVAHTPGVVTPI